MNLSKMIAQYSQFTDEIVQDKKTVFLLLILAFLVRIGLAVILDKYHFNSDWEFGYEAGQIAANLAEGRGFSSPFAYGSEPTAWIAPLYPMLLAGLFALFGTYSATAAFIAIFINCIFSAAACFGLYLLAHKLYDRKVAILTMLLACFSPMLIWQAIDSVWDINITFFLLTIILVQQTKSLESGLTTPALLTLGCLMGFILLFNPAIALYYPFYIFLYLGKGPGALQEKLAKSSLITGICILLLSPFLIRNYIVFQSPVFLKSNLGTELYVGNNPNSIGTFMANSPHPTVNREEKKKYQEMGEIAYNSHSMQRAISFIKTSPSTFYHLTLKRIYLFWVGDITGEISQKRHQPRLRFILKKSLYFLVVPFALCGIILTRQKHRHLLIFMYLFLFPITYYFTHILPRYKVLTHGILVVYMAYAVLELLKMIKGTDTILGRKR